MGHEHETMWDVEYLLVLLAIEEIGPVGICLHQMKLKQLSQTQTQYPLCYLQLTVV